MPDYQTIAEKLLTTCRKQHRAIDLLMAHLILADRAYLPSKDEQVWPLVVDGNETIQWAEGETMTNETTANDYGYEIRPDDVIKEAYVFRFHTETEAMNAAKALCKRHKTNVCVLRVIGSFAYETMWRPGK